ncbi:MAG: TonB-dependent receptor, partial [Tannerella sp.]|nr:TonB-dependent receptor [Tannerella sp.]
GNFTLRAQSLPVTLSVHFLGYKTSETEIHEYTGAITILLREDADLLDEVVVIGYGTQRRKELTGSVASVSKAVLEHVNVPSFDGLLGGAIAGVNVTQSSGQPGAGSSIRIRGGNSINAGNEPLYVIDGFIFYSDNSSTSAGISQIESNLNPLASINPADIESIEVLKDVSATAIYGSRGANGVIIVTTKKGKRGSNTISYQYTFGQEQVSKKLNLMNAEQWARFQNEYGYNYFKEEDIATVGKGSDWQEAIFRTAHIQKHELTISGGDEKTRYLLSGSYINQEGILINTGFERYNGRVNLDRDLYKNLVVSLSLTGSKSIQNGVTALESSNPTYQGRFTNPLGYALRISPWVAIYNSDGSYNYHNPYENNNDMTNYRNENPNPISDMNNSVGQNITTSLLGNFYAQYTIIDGLVAKANYGSNFSNTTQNFFSPSTSLVGLLPNGIAGIGNRRYEIWQQEYTLNYSNYFNRIHSFNALVGYTTQNTSARSATAMTADFTKEDLTFNDLYAGNQPDFPRSSERKPWLRSLLGRVNYTLLNRYNLTATIRADESSRFAPGHRWGYFPSIGVSWNVNEERFLKDNQTLSTLKLRVTYGSVGNQEIGDNLWSPSYVAGKSSDSGKTITIYRKARKGNPDLKWETTVQYNLGVDIGLWQDRLTLVSDVYYKKTNDLLYTAPIESSEGFSSQMVNVGNVTNKGVEFELNSIILEEKDIRWSVSANIARNINTIIDLGRVNQILSESGGTSASTEMVLRVGHSLNSFYGLVFDGVVQKEDDVSQLPELGWRDGPLQPGDPIFADVDGNGIINDKDRIIIGTVHPDFTYGFSTAASYKKLDLFASFQGSKGNRVYNRLRRDLETPNGSYNFSAALLNRWTEDNPSRTIPRISQDLRFSYLDSRYVEDASHLRLKNITLGYTLPIKTHREAPTVNIRFFVSAQNLFTITPYKGYDPEIGSGRDLGVYPKARTFSAGAGITF